MEISSIHTLGIGEHKSWPLNQHGQIKVIVFLNILCKHTEQKANSKRKKNDSDIKMKQKIIAATIIWLKNPNSFECSICIQCIRRASNVCKHKWIRLIESLVRLKESQIVYGARTYLILHLQWSKNQHLYIRLWA